MQIPELVYRNVYTDLDPKIYDTLRNQLPLYLSDSKIADTLAEFLTERYQKYSKFLFTYCSLVNRKIVENMFGINKVVDRKIIDKLVENGFPLLDIVTRRSTIDMVYSVADIVLNQGKLYQIIVKDNDPLDLITDGLEEVTFRTIKDYVPYSFLDEIKKVKPPIYLPLYIAKITYHLDNFHKVMAVVSTMLYENDILTTPDATGLTPLEKFTLNYLIFAKNHPEMLTPKDVVNTGPLKQHILTLQTGVLQHVMNTVLDSKLSQTDIQSLYNYVSGFSSIDDLYNTTTFEDLPIQDISSRFFIWDLFEKRIFLSYLLSHYLKYVPSSSLDQFLKTFNISDEYYWIPAYIQNPFFYAKYKDFSLYKFLLSMTDYLFNKSSTEEFVSVQNYAADAINTIFESLELPLRFQKQISLQYVYKIRDVLYKVFPIYAHIVDVIIESILNGELVQRIAVLTESSDVTIFGSYLDEDLVQSLAVLSDQASDTKYGYPYTEDHNQITGAIPESTTESNYWTALQTNPITSRVSVVSASKRDTDQI